MTNLTRIILHNNNRKVLHLLASPERIHATVLHGFMNGTHDRVLWRTDTRRDLTFVYIVSQEAPNYDFVNDMYDSEASYRTTSYDAFLDSIHEGNVYSFVLACNPIINKNNGADASTRGKRVPLVGRLAREWVVKKLTECGGSHVILSPEHDESNIVFTKKGCKKVTLKRQVFTGTITVSNAGLFRDAMVSGIGAAKAYGCGLLTLVPSQ